jgi:hypothetical protein
MVETQAITVRLPRDLYESLRSFAFQARVSMNELVLDALRRDLEDISPEKYADLCALFEAAWHHAVPESLDNLAPVTSKEARSLALLADQVMSR